MCHTITIRLTAVFGLVLACLAVGTVLAGSPDKSIIEEEDIWAYKKFIRSYEAIYAIRKQGSLLPEVESALSSGIEMTIVLLDRSTSAASAKALAYMNLLKLDGAASKDQTCAVLRKGKSIIPYLEQAKAARTSGRCVMQEVNIKPDQVFCADPEDALRRIENQISTIRSGETCMHM